MQPFMNERFYWDEFDAALKPAAGLGAVLAAVLVASLTLPATARDAGMARTATHTTATHTTTSPTPEALPACHQMAPEAAAPVAPHAVAHHAATAPPSTPR